jgi:hypothetical protein
MKKVLAAFLLIVLAGCENMGTMGAGNEKFDPAWIRQHVVIGHTTEQDIVSLYGEPGNKSTDSSVLDTWTYRKNRSGSNVLSTVSGFIPGMATANQAANMADVQQKGGSGDNLYFRFKNGVLKSWFN